MVSTININKLLRLENPKEQKEEKVEKVEKLAKGNQRKPLNQDL